ncbi:filamin-B-like [Brevipalpus obovatus]|uniref:filamin-B-like n=1 Tax=Brevipalpus obovatus TaxID=246614 RepID=UPI003D9DBDF5
MHGNGIAIGNGLLSGRANIFNEFIVHTGSSDPEAGVSINVEGPDDVELRHIDSNDASIKVQYKPLSPGYYWISVKQNGLHVKGSPFQVPVYDSNCEPPFLPKSSTEMDPALMNGYENGPFGDPNRVKVGGRGLYRGISNVQSEILVDTRKAGLGRVSWTIDGPISVQTRHINIVSGLHKLLYVTQKKGMYIVRIKFNEIEVPGSPFKLRVM